MSARTHKHMHSRLGFGLVELLVSIALFLTIIGSIAVIFNGSLQALRQAEQSQDVFEMVRGAQQVMERDLANAFVAREYGDFYQFYGTPIGFTFVGLVQFHPDDEPNLARVTYALRRDSQNVIRRDTSFEYVDASGNTVSMDSDGIDNDLDRPLLDTDGIDNDGDGDIDEGADGLDNDGDGLIDEADESEGVDEEGEGREVPTFSLIRYVERGATDLESFPINWTEGQDEFGASFQDRINLVVQASNDLGICETEPGNDGIDNDGDGDIDEVDERTSDCLAELDKSIKREFWIRALANSTDLAGNEFPNVLEDDLNLDREDYVLLENIVIDNEGLAFLQNFDNITSLNPLTSAEARIAQDFGAVIPSAQVLQNGQNFQYAQWVGGSADAEITNATQTNPVEITMRGRVPADGADILIENVQGMIELNTRNFTVANVTGNTFELQGEDGTAHTPYIGGGNVIRTIDTITQSDPIVVTSNGHGLQNGDRIRIAEVGGMTELEGNLYTVIDADANTFGLAVGNIPVDSTLFGAHTANSGEIFAQLTAVRPNVLGFWSDYRNMDLAKNGIDDDGDGVVDCFDGDELFPAAEATDGIDNDGDGLIDCLDPDELPRSLNNDGIDNDGDGLTDEGDEWLFAPGPGPGSPIVPSIPSQVQVRFRVFFSSAISGASDFERNFKFDIDVPVGYRRLGLE